MRFLFVWIGLILLLTGCAATSSGPAQPFASRSLFKKPVAEKKDDGEKTAATDKPAKSENPFRKNTASERSSDDSSLANVASADSKSAESTAETERDGSAATPGRDGARQKNPGAFHAETLRVINGELADASAAERAFWYDQLKQVDPAVIPQILQARRLTAQIVEQRQQEEVSSEEKPDDRLAWAKEAAAPAGPRNGKQNMAPDDASVTQTAGRQFAGSRADLNLALHESDGLSSRPQIEQQGYSGPASAPKKPAYAVQQATDTAPQAPPKSNTSRMALSRLLPTGRSAAQSSANSPSPVTLMPPAELAASTSATAQLESLISNLEAEIALSKPGNTEDEQTEYVQRHVYLRMLYLMARHPERALTAIPGIDSADQEFWQQTLWAMTNYFDADHLPAAKDRAGQAAAQLSVATQRLRERADLEIHNLAFCREIAYFGNFVRFPRDEFRPGDDLLLYAEIENFKSELTVDGQYRTLLRSTVEILSPSGEVRWHKEFPATEDLCVNYRRDYFHNYQFSIPDQLPLGPHSLKLTVFDELSNKMVSQSINFIVR